MNSPRIIRLERDATDRPWGFRLQGGSEFPVPLTIQLVNPNTPAYTCGLNAGDQVISINNQDVTNLTHEEAKMEITRSGNKLELTVIKGGVTQPTSQSSGQIKIGPGSQIPASQVGVSNQASVGSSHHQSAIPSDAQVTYETAKGTYWPPNDYTQETPENLRPKVSTFESSPAYNRDPLQREIWRPKAYRDNPQAPSRQVGTAVYHAQYNSPIGLYSDDKVLEAFKSQTAGLIDEIKGNTSPQSSINSNDVPPHPQSPTYQAVMNKDQQQTLPYSSEGKISRSFRALEQDLSSIQGTSQAPKSIFDQRRQQRY